MKIVVFICFLFSYLLIYSQTFKLVSPKNNQTQLDNEVEFEWDDILGVEFYTLNIQNLSSQTDENHTVLGSDISILLPFGDYQAKVTATLQNGSSLETTTRDFSVLDFYSLNPVLWLNPDSLVNYDQDNRVDNWGDASLNENSVSQTNAVAKPLFVETIPELNNKPCLRFDGNDVLNSPSLGLLDVEIFTVVKGNSVNNRFFGFGQGYHVNFINSRPILYLQGSNYRYFQGLQETGVYQIHNVGWQDGSASDNTAFLKINKTPLDYSNAVNGSGFILENLSVGSGNLNGDIAEVIVFGTNISEEQREKVEQYLIYKYSPPVCLGKNIDSYSFCDTTLNAGERFTSYLWSTGETTPSISVSESGQYWVEVTDIFGFTSSDTITVTYPSVSLPTTSFYCQDQSITWETNLDPSIYSFEWSTGETIPSINITSENEYFVRVTDTLGCFKDSDTLFISEDPIHTELSLGDDLELCSGNSIQLVSGDSEIVSYEWNTNESTSSIIIENSGTYQLTATNANGCSETDQIEVTIIGDAPIVNLGLEANYCQEDIFEFTDESTTTDGSSIVAWNWSFPDSEYEVETGSHSFSQSGIKTVELTVTSSSGCSNTSSTEVEVFPKAQISFTTQNFCQGDEIQFLANQSSASPIANWEWDFGDPDSGEINEASGPVVVRVFDNSGDYSVTLSGEDANGCAAIVEQNVFIRPAPQVGFSFDEVCEGNIVQFVNESTIDSPASISSQTWQFGDGTSAGQPNPAKTYFNPGLFNITLTVNGNNSCSNTLTKEMKVHAFPQVDRTIGLSCAGIETTLTDDSFVINGSVAEVLWTAGAIELTGFEVNPIFETQGNNLINQTVTSAFGCSSSENFIVPVQDFISVDFTSAPSFSATNGIIADFPTNFQSTGEGASSFNWEVDENFTSNNPSFSITIAEDQVGNAIPVTLTVANELGCETSLTRIYTIVEKKTDLAIQEIFTVEDNGFITYGVRLKNNGTTPINQAELLLRTTNTALIKEKWEGALDADEEEIYIFSAVLPSTVSSNANNQNIVCIEAVLISEFDFEDKDLTNNKICQNISTEDQEAVLLRPYPNPVDDNLVIRIVLPKEEIISVNILDPLGKILKEVVVEKPFNQGLTELPVNVSGWSYGKYQIVMRTESGVYYAPFVVGR